MFTPLKHARASSMIAASYLKKAQPMQTVARYSLVLSLLATSFVFADEKDKSLDAKAADSQPATKSEKPQTKKAATTAELYELHYKFKRGEFLHYETNSSSTMTVAAGNFSQVLKETRQTQKHLRVVAVDAKGSVVLEPVIDHVVMTAQGDDNDAVVFDSESKRPAPQQFRGVAVTLGKAIIRVRYSSTGDIEEVLPIPGLEEKLPKDESTHAFLVVLPGEPVSVGKNWNDDFKVAVSVTRTLSRTVTIRRRYTLEKVADGFAYITFRTYPLSLVKDAHTKAQLIQRSLSGLVKFDIDKGRIVEWSSRGSGQVFGAFGATSAMEAKSKSMERYVAKPRSRNVLKVPEKKKPAPKLIGPVGPPVAAAAR